MNDFKNALEIILDEMMNYPSLQWKDFLNEDLNAYGIRVFRLDSISNQRFPRETGSEKILTLKGDAKDRTKHD